MIDRANLSRDLVDCRGRVLARRGQEIAPRSIAEAAATVRPEPGRPLSSSVVLEDVRDPFGDAALTGFFRMAAVQAAVTRVVLSAHLPEALHEELRLLRDKDWLRYRHAVATAAVATRMFLAAVGEARALPDLAAAALLHDLGMRHVEAHLARTGAQLEPHEVRAVAAHPFLGAFHLATQLGRHPAVDAALGHHWRCGLGYPALPLAPPRSVQVIAVASAFNALTQARPFRATAFDVRGATDVLVADARAGEADHEAVQLLVHVLRGAHGDVRLVRFGRERLGHQPRDNRHTPIARAMA